MTGRILFGVCGLGLTFAFAMSTGCLVALTDSSTGGAGGTGSTGNMTSGSGGKVGATNSSAAVTNSTGTGGQCVAAKGSCNPQSSNTCCTAGGTQMDCFQKASGGATDGLCCADESKPCGGDGDCCQFTSGPTISCVQGKCVGKDDPNCQHCKGCTTGCGTPQSAQVNLCNYNNGGGTSSSFGLYKTYFDCLCGTDGKSGKCGSVCPKTCVKQGTDQASCMTCLSGAVSGSCFSAYSACNKD